MSGPRRPHYGSFYLSLAVPAAFIGRLPVALARLFWGPRPSAADRIPEVPPPSSIPGLRLDPAKVAAAADAICLAILSGVRTISSHWPRQSDPADWNGGDDDDDVESSLPVDQHLGYPPIQSLEVGGASLFVPGSTPRRRGARQGDGVRRYVYVLSKF
jgi:hypothetical protein